MSPRRTRAATMEQSVSTRSKARKINNVNEDVIKQTRQSQKKEKSSDVKNNLEATTKQSARKESPNAKIIFRKSVKKKVTRRRLNLAEELEAEDKVMAQENWSSYSNESIRVLRDKRNDNMSMTELVKNDLSQSSTSKDSDTDKMSSEKLEQKNSVTVVNVSPLIVTPKSTPPKLSLTPHRSKKTPKKSPISLGSPKTHSLTVPRLFKSPRKLSLATTSEEDSDKLKNSSHKKSRKIKNSLGNVSNKSLLTSAVKDKSYKKSTTINLKTIVRKFSKSPKIVLRSPKKSKSARKLKLLSQGKKSPLKRSTPKSTPNLDTKSRVTSTKETPLFKGKNLAIKHRLLDSRLTKAMTPSQIKDVLAEPIVLLEKLSSENVQKAASKTRSNTSIKIESPLVSLGNNSKVLTPIITRISTESIVPVNQNFNTKLRNSNMERSRNSISRMKQNTSVQNKDRSSIPLMSSTPREEKTSLILMNLTSNTPIVLVDNAFLNTKSRQRNQSNTQLSSVNKSTIIENVSKSSLFSTDVNNSSQSHLSNVKKQDTTYDNNSIMTPVKEKNKRDNTYELEQPQTLNLRQMIKKRTSTDANLNSEKDSKRAKVHFADVTSGRGSTQSISKSTRSRSNISAQRSNIINSAHKLKKIETPKFGRNSVSSFKARLSPRTNGVTSKAQLSGMQVTPKTFMSIEKKSEKKSSVKRKIPNFEKIHEQMFAKSESLVDAKKRLAARHLSFTANKNPKVDVKKEEKKPLPTDTRDGTHNRFGFKLRKAEATHVILKKQAAFSRQKKQHETRMMLQGVRTNRRFELQMKARNLNA